VGLLHCEGCCLFLVCSGLLVVWSSIRILNCRRVLADSSSLDNQRVGITYRCMCGSKNYFAQIHEQSLIKSTQLEFKISIQEMFDFGYDSFRLHSGA
jgi:hypothetical protein